MNQKKILVIDDEPDILKFVSYNLDKEGYAVCTAEDGFKGIQKAKAENPDLILLDVMMPEMDGIETCRSLREMDQFENTIIAFLSARSEDYTQIAGFDSGGDDFIVKPIIPSLLSAKIKALFNRRKRGLVSDQINAFNSFLIDQEKRLVYKENEVIELPKKEFELLLLLTSKPGKVFSRESIYQALWGNDHMVGGRTLDVYIRKLREKLGDQIIKTLKGVGYKFTE